MKQFFWHVLPKTIAMQITSLVIASLLLAFGMTIVVFFLFDPPAPSRDQFAAIVKIATIAQLANAAKSIGDADRLLAAARSAGIPVEQVPLTQIAVDTEQSENPRLSTRLNRLGDTHGIVVLENAVVPGRTDQTTIVKLGDSNALVFGLSPKSGAPRIFTIPAVFILSIAAVVIIVLSVYAAKWITAPLSSFAAAAHSFGRYPSGDRQFDEKGPREITQLARALNEMRTRVRTLVDNRTRMMAAIGHDLRTPLTRLRLRVERLDDTASRQGMIRDITAINDMLTETLSYVRDDLRSGKNLRIDLPSLLQTICSEFADIGHEVSYQGPNRLEYRGRSGALTRALSNLIENGVKHGSKVSVGLKLRNDVVEIEVSDNGPGMPAALREKAFEPFFKGDAARGGNENTGFGLGLSIAHDVVRSHGGEIGLHDHIPRGLTVRLMLPIRRPDIAMQDDDAGASRPSARDSA